MLKRYFVNSNSGLTKSLLNSKYLKRYIDSCDEKIAIRENQIITGGGAFVFVVFLILVRD